MTDPAIRKGGLPTAAQVFGGLPRFFRRHKLMRSWMALTGETPLQLVRIRGDSYGFADLSDGFLRLIVIDGSFEPELLGLADAFLSEGGVFLDVGANHGLVSFGLAGRHGDRVEFHLFEPNSNLLSAIARSRELYPAMRCRVVPKAVTDHEGVVPFLVVPNQTGISHIDPEGEHAVPTVMLDSYLSAAGVDEVALMKIDIEGYELRALRGAESRLKSRRISAIYFEYCERHLARDQGHLALLGFLAGVGYEVCFCRRGDYMAHDGATHTLRSGLPGHGVQLTPIVGRRPQPETDLLAVPRENLVELAVA